MHDFIAPHACSVMRSCAAPAIFGASVDARHRQTPASRGARTRLAKPRSHASSAFPVARGIGAEWVVTGEPSRGRRAARRNQSPPLAADQRREYPEADHEHYGGDADQRPRHAEDRRPEPHAHHGTDEEKPERAEVPQGLQGRPGPPAGGQCAGILATRARKTQIWYQLYMIITGNKPTAVSRKVKIEISGLAAS